MRRMLAATAMVAASLLTTFTHAAADEPAGRAHGRSVDLRVATYNIQAGAGMDRRFDLARTAEAILGLDADVVGLQEVDVHWSARSEWRDLATELAQRLDMRVFFAPIYSLDPLGEGQPRREFGVAVLSRHPIVYARNHEITRLSTQVPDPVPELAPGFAEVIVNVRGALVHVYVTHLDFRADPAVRALQVADTLRIMGCWRGHQQILLGDLNARPDAAELSPLWHELADAWTAANGGADGGLTYPASAPDRRIDYVAVSSRMRVNAANVVPTQASDHLPAVVDLVARRGW